MRVTRIVKLVLLAGLVVSAGLALAARSTADDGRDTSAPAVRLPRLVDVGADRCIPCQAMAPMIGALRDEYAGRMDVQVIDAWRDPGAAEPFEVRELPTHIFLDADGRELWRHEGLMSRAEILARWKDLGVEL